MKILIVEDNEGDQDLLQEAFKESALAINPIFADTADKAQSILKKEKPSEIKLIILDLNLPRKNGKDFLRELKTDQKFQQIPIIIWTSSTVTTDISECYELGANCFLTKPSTFNELESTIKSLCNFWLKKNLIKK